ncbi:phospholipase A1 [Roseateles sp. YR242]|nr:phospholipase A1 [Roseateles sp. YR242]
MGATAPATVAASSDAPLSADACTRIPDATDRLACYDRIHGRAAPEPVTAPPTLNGATTNAIALVPVAAPNQPAANDPVDPCARPASLTGSARDYLGSTLSERWELSCRDQLPAFLPRPYKPVYLLPVSWTSRANQAPRTSESPDNGVVDALGLNKNEAKFQVSLKSKLWSLNDHGTLALWGGYTQSSRWQVYNGRISRPFRETNYEPELMLTHGMGVALPFGWTARMASLSLNHQSNGRAQPYSRSWNRVIGEVSLERNDTTVSLRPWVRLHDGSDDNPGIEDYVGRAEMLVTHKWGRNVFSVQARHSLRSGDRSRGSGQLEWAFPIGGGLHGYAQLFSGYGESLIDYNFRETRFGLGISVVEWR